MNLSDYQILNVIKTYIRNMRGKVESEESTQEDARAADGGISSREGMKKIVYDRIDEIVSEKVKRHETQ